MVNSIQQLANKWTEARETKEVLEDIQTGEEDIKAGRSKPAAQAFSDIREKLAIDYAKW